MLLDDIKKYNIILASQSQRRVELMRGLGLNFIQAELSDTDESYPDNLAKNEIPVYVAQKKSNSYNQKLNENDILITVDTIVWCNGEMFGKPKNKSDAFRMLKTISNNTHEVLSGVCLRSATKNRNFVVASTVHFKAFTDDEIEFYINNYQPYDKAGAYGIQEWIGFSGLIKIEGSYFNVMGLPSQNLYAELEMFINENQ
ncbi:MAG: Maf family nucleotide pyrophosphatase [Prevotellaceae bacterium]|jgi:septum formation protein|nr:Maf family nucleotide pyrophosphatase [Prevotellaceae bacterium]